MGAIKPFVVRIALSAGMLGLVALACQGPDAFYRSSESAGTGGTGTTGTGGTSTTGTGGSSVVGTGGSSATGGSTGTGTGGTVVAGTGGTISTGTGGTTTTGTGGTTTTGKGGTTGTGGTTTTGKGGTTGTGGTTTTGAGGTTGTGGTSVTGAGGTVATGGTKGAGGAVGGAGGSTPAGGSTGSGCTGCKVAIDTYCQSPTANQIGLYMDIENSGQPTLTLNQITIRYWFQQGETTDPGALDIDYSQKVPSADITSKFVAVTPAVKGANEYLEIGFTTAAGTIAGFSDTSQIQMRIHAVGYSNMFDTTPASDYSFQACATGATANAAPFAPAMTITAYINGVLSWGTEPM